jgi:hypothetical protein
MGKSVGVNNTLEAKKLRLRRMRSKYGLKWRYENKRNIAARLPRKS